MNDNLAKSKYITCGCSYLKVNENISDMNKLFKKTYKEKLLRFITNVDTFC